MTMIDEIVFSLIDQQGAERQVFHPKRIGKRCGAQWYGLSVLSTDKEEFLMKKAFIFLVLSVLAFPLPAKAGIDLPYTSSALTCAEATYLNGGVTGCDGVTGEGGGPVCGGMQITTAANYPGGAGGRGFRVWYNDGNNAMSPAPTFNFNSPPTELWTRHYIRWQAGFNGAGMFQKMLYLYLTPDVVQSIMDITGPNACVYTAQGMPNMTCYQNGTPKPECPTSEWKAVCGNHPWFDGTNHSTGTWAPIEFHHKTNTPGQNNGIFEMWLNGVLVFSKSNINFGGGGGVNKIKFPSNNQTLQNGGCAYYDEDDFAFSTTGRIGPYSGSPPPPTPPQTPTPPAIQSIN
jgi:hypothetical protein